MTPDELVNDVVRRAITLAETDAMNLGISPLQDSEVDLIAAGATHALTALAEISRESA